MGLEATIAYDATNFIRASLWEVVKTLSEAALIVVVVIFLFLGNLRSTIIPIVTIPLSLIGVLGLLLALGYSINLMTLLALVLAIGLVVDDAIVVVENIYRHIEEGKKPMEAALLGAREIVYPIIAMTITLAAVFAPIGFVSGLTGALFKEFAFTLAGAVLVSGIVALTLSPMMCSRLLKAHNGGGGGRFTAFLDRMFDGLKQRYQRQAARHAQLPAGDPARARRRHRRDRAHVYDHAEGARAGRGPGHPVHPGEDAAIRQSRLSRGRDPAALQGLFARCPRRSTCSPSTAWATCIRALPASCSSLGASGRGARRRCCKELEPRISSIATAQAIAFSPPALPGSVGGPPIQFVITTTRDARELADVLADVEKSARESGMFIFSDSDLRFETPQIEFHIDHDKANRLGISMADIGSSLATLLGGNYVNLFDLYGRSYRVIPQVPRDFRLNESWLTRYQIRTASGTLVPLVECRDDHEDGAAERAHQFPAAQFGDAVGGAVPRAHRRARRSNS